MRFVPITANRIGVARAAAIFAGHAVAACLCGHSGGRLLCVLVPSRRCGSWRTACPASPSMPSTSRKRMVPIPSTEMANSPASASACMTDLGRRFLGEYVPAHRKPSTLAEYRHSVRLFADSAVGELSVREVQRKDVAALHHGLRDKPYQAKMFFPTEVWGWRADGSNPCRRVKHYREHRRERFLQYRWARRCVRRKRRCRRPSPPSACYCSPAAGCRRPSTGAGSM